MSLRARLSQSLVAACGLLAVACGGAPTGPTALVPSVGAGAATTARVASAAANATAATGANLQMSGSASTGSLNTGGTLTYVYQVKNSGPEIAMGAIVTDSLPAGTTYQASRSSETGCTFVAPVVTCDIGNVPSGGQAWAEITIIVPTTAGTFSNTATTSSQMADPDQGNNTVTITTQVKVPVIDSIKVSKCYTNATTTSGGQMLIKASSSDPTATLMAYRPDGSLIGWVQNGGGSRYGGTVMPYQPYDPVTVTIRSSSGGSTTVPTTPFQP